MSEKVYRNAGGSSGSPSSPSVGQVLLLRQSDTAHLFSSLMAQLLLVQAPFCPAKTSVLHLTYCSKHLQPSFCLTDMGRSCCIGTALERIYGILYDGENFCRFGRLADNAEWTQKLAATSSKISNPLFMLSRIIYRTAFFANAFANSRVQCTYLKPVQLMYSLPMLNSEESLWTLAQVNLSSKCACLKSHFGWRTSQAFCNVSYIFFLSLTQGIFHIYLIANPHKFFNRRMRCSRSTRILRP